MRLSELNAKLVKRKFDSESDEWYLDPVSTLAESEALSYDCPCKTGHELLTFTASAVQGIAPGRSVWNASGNTIENLTLTPSVAVMSGCGAHFFITNGEIKRC